MPKLYSSKDIEKVLLRRGFILAGQKGSHARYKDNLGHTAILPANRKEIPLGTFRSILKQANLSTKDFELDFSK